MTAAQAKGLAADPRVAWVEQDREIEALAVQVVPHSWGLDRIDERDRPLGHRFTYTSDGAGVNIYVIDSGVAANASELGSRLINAYSNALDGSGNPQFGDPVGHGSKVAIFAAGTISGVAKGAKVRAVRIKSFTCGIGFPGGPEVPAFAGTCFTLADVVDAINWVAANRITPAVANLSLGGGASATLDTAVNGLINAGVTTVVAAGNSNADACNVSPARVANAITVAASDINDARAVWTGGGASNFGSCVNVFAPGKDVLVYYVGVFNGTSFASPMVAGVAAQYLKTAPSATPATVKNYIVNNATSGRLTGIGAGSPNKLLFAPPGGVETDNFPVPKYVFSCVGRTCTFTNQSTDDFGFSFCYWNWGHDFQLTESCAPSVVHTFPYGGSFTVRLAVTDDGLQTAWIEKVVTVN
jgi:subtilisin family serine protease